MKVLQWFGCVVLTISFLTAQEVDQKILLVQLGYGVQTPMQDLQSRFGSGFIIPAGVDYMWGKQLFLGFLGNYQFGSTVHEDVLKNLRDPSGDIIGTNGSIADIALRARGWQVGIHGGKCWPFQSGSHHYLKTGIELGYWNHWIRILDNSQSVVQVQSPYDAGYDRLTGGIFTGLELGWLLLHPNKKMNFQVSAHYRLGFTKGLRDWDFATMSALTQSRKDGQLAVEASIILPFYFNKDADHIEY